MEVELATSAHEKNTSKRWKSLACVILQITHEISKEIRTGTSASEM